MGDVIRIERRRPGEASVKTSERTIAMRASGSDTAARNAKERKNDHDGSALIFE